MERGLQLSRLSACPSPQVRGTVGRSVARIFERLQNARALAPGRGQAERGPRFLRQGAFEERVL